MGNSLGQAEGGRLMEFLGDVAAFFTDPANWTGSRGILNRLWEHVSISVIGVLVAAVLALPPAVYLGHVKRGGFLAVSAVNIGRAVPSFGVVGIMFPITLSFALLTSPLGYWATLIALILLAMPPMFVNAYVGVSEVEPALVEAATGMGMNGRQILAGVELPLAMPLIMAGVRTAAVAVVATATLGAVVGYGGLGRYIIDGFAQGNDVLIFAGGILVATLAIITELSLAAVERRTDPTQRATRASRRTLTPPVGLEVAEHQAP
jgi:osmoprotectant transport system permease protein